jgi:hypothetical protein
VNCPLRLNLRSTNEASRPFRTYRYLGWPRGQSRRRYAGLQHGHARCGRCGEQEDGQSLTGGAGGYGKGLSDPRDSVLAHLTQDHHSLTSYTMGVCFNAVLLQSLVRPVQHLLRRFADALLRFHARPVPLQTWSLLHAADFFVNRGA